MEPWTALACAGIMILVCAKFFIRERSSSKLENRELSKEMENTVAALSLEMKEENDRLMMRIKDMKEQMELKMKDLEKKTERLAVLKETGGSEQVENQRAVKPSLNIHTRYKEVLSLYHQKIPMSEIAKLTGIDTGEIRLIVRLAKDEEAGSVVS